MLNILIDCDKSFIPKAQYVFETFFTYYRAKTSFFYKYEDINNDYLTVIYSNKLNTLIEDKNNLIFFQSKETIEFFKNQLKPNKNHVSNLKSFKPLFTCGKERNSEEFDLIASCFYFLSLWQEQDNQLTDIKGRFLAKDSIQYEAKNLETPLVDLWFNLLAEKISKRGLEIKKVDLLNNKKNIINLSHDIDFVYENYIKLFNLAKKKVYNLIYNKQNKNLSSFSYNRLFPYKQKDIFNILYINTIKKGFNSTFNIMMEYSKNDLNAIYKLCKVIDGSNCEIGIHPVMNDFNIDENLVYKFKKKYKVRNVHGMRIHELAFSPDDLYSLLEKNNEIFYDNSIMFPDLPGFRTSFSLPHKYYSKKDNRIMDIVCIPVFTMDTSFTKYMKLSEKETEDRMNEIIQNNIIKGGITSILIHNNFFYSRTKQRIKLYKKWMNEIFESEGSVVSTRDMFFWYKELTKNNAN